MKFENKTFTEDVTLDFNEFIRCTFEGCTIHFHGHPYSLVEVNFGRVRFAMHGAANDTLNFLKSLRQVFPEQVEQMFQNAGAPTMPLGTKAN